MAFMFSDARSLADCPKCGAKAGWNCQQPSGRRAWPPHRERLQAFRKSDKYHLENYEVIRLKEGKFESE